jgi:hypothetical protein
LREGQVLLVEGWTPGLNSSPTCAKALRIVTGVENNLIIVNYPDHL